MTHVDLHARPATVLRGLAILAVLGFGALGACGGSSATNTPSSAARAAPQAKAPATPGEKCLADAAAPRERKSGLPDKIEIAHVLVRHAQAKVAGGHDRTREEACLRALEALEKLQSGADWNDVAAEYSDEKGADTRFGKLGRIEYDDLDPQFGNAAFSLDVNELSYVVETPSGYHVIVRLE